MIAITAAIYSQLFYSISRLTAVLDQDFENVDNTENDATDQIQVLHVYSYKYYFFWAD